MLISPLFGEAAVPPSISGPTNLCIPPTAPAPLVDLIVGDEDSAPESLVLAAYSSNTNLLPASAVVFGGSGSNRTATLQFNAGIIGTSFVSLVVTDPTGLSATNNLRLEVSYFSDITPSMSGSNYFAARWADFDNDGDLDVYLGGNMYRNDGNGVFQATTPIALAGGNQFGWCDYNNDGRLDFVSSSNLYRNEGGGAFSLINAGLQGLYWGAVAWGDYNNDGRPDLLVAGTSDSSGDDPVTTLYRNDGNDRFTAALGTGLPALGHTSLAWGDYNNDGRLDILMNGLGWGPLDWFADIYRNNGDGTFTSIGAGFTGGADGAVDFGDYDNDGRLDALVTGFNLGTYVLHIYHNNGNGTFTEVIPALTGVQYGTAHWVDFDNDGNLDILATGCTANYCDYSMTTIYRNCGNGTFTNGNVGLPRSGNSGGWGDFDQDGDLDLWLGSLYRNNSVISNSAPSAPTGLSAELLPDNNVRLSWEPASDVQNTSSAGLSYAIRVGTTPGGDNFLSAQADPATGFRRLPQRGPLSTNTAFLRDVPQGTYYWSVQAIDAGFLGSAFAVEGSFSVSNARPVISGISNLLTVPGRSTPSIPFTVSDLETPATELVVTGVSLDTNLVSSSGFIFAGTNSERSLVLSPNPGRSGTATIIVSVADAAGLVATSRFDLVIQSFSEQACGFPNVNTCLSAWGDYDKDGWLDAVLLASGTTRIYRNSNGTNFTATVSNLPARDGADLAWVDYDNDDDVDLALQGWSGGYSPVFYLNRNNGSNSFTSLTGFGVTNVADGAFAWGDYDNDGDQDVLVTGDPDTYHAANGYTGLFQNSRTGFSLVTTPFPKLVKSAVAWGDFDNDGDLDLVMAGSNDVTSVTTKLFRNDGSNVFTELPTTLPPATRCGIALADFNNDGKLDIALAGLGTNAVSFTRIFRNTGSNSFVEIATSLNGFYDPVLAWGDYDNDGFADLAICGTRTNSPVTRLIHNNNGLSFTDTGSALTGVNGTVSWADYDHDGDLDLLAGSRLYRNNYNLINTPPTTPTALSATVNQLNRVDFNWQPSTDMQTTNAGGLSYNLRIGTNSGGSQIMSANADAGNGVRRVAAGGNVGAVTTWSLSTLTNGTYYWSVQAIDPGLAASSFAPEQVLVVSRPVISLITNYSMMPNTTLGPINFTVSDPETPPASLILSVTSSDTNLVPAANLVLSGSYEQRTLTITPAPNQSGFVTITLLATDESGQSCSMSFRVTVERFAEVFSRSSSQAGPVAWGDYNGDGRLDLLTRNFIYRNEGNGSFSNVVTLTPPVEGSANWGDFDGDSDLDLLVTGANASRIMRNEGDGSFVDTVAGLPPTSSYGCSAWGDYDNDGDLDVVIAGNSFVRLYRNNPNRTFSNMGAALPAFGGSVAWGDYDNDGDLDLLLSTPYVAIYRNDGNAIFTDLGASFPNLYNSCIAWGDYNNDGRLDFAVAGATNQSTGSSFVTWIYRHTTNTTANLMFTNICLGGTQNLVGVRNGTVAWGDYDNDGDLDLLVTGIATNSLGITKLYRNDGGSFVDSGYSLPGQIGYGAPPQASFAAWGDFDGDHYLDLVLGGTSFTKVFRNISGDPANTPPVAPGGLFFTPTTNHAARLNWQVATDANQATGLTYNVRGGTAPGLDDVFPSMSLTDGTRLIPARGNAGSRTNLIITNIPGGTTYWSVQAIDASFAGSIHSTQLSLTLSNRGPVAFSDPFSLYEDTTLNINLRATDLDWDPMTFRIVTPPRFGTLQGTPPNVVYVPFSHYFGPDQFVFVANDRVADSNPCTNTISVLPVEDVPDASLRILGFGTNQFEMSLTAEPWTTWEIQFSEDLVHWASITNGFSTNRFFHFTDTNMLDFEHRFYRVLKLPAK